MSARPPHASPFLHAVALVDGTGSFALPVVLLAAVPLLAVLDAPAALIGGLVLLAAVVLGGCGVVLAATMTRALYRGEPEHPELLRFLAETSR